MGSINPPVPVKVVNDLTTEWLASCLKVDNLESFSTERIGTGQLSECFRVSLHYSSPSSSGPKSVILKVTAEEETSRQSGLSLGIYHREVLFYDSVAETLDSKAIAKCYHASFDGTLFCLLLDDAYPALPGNDLEGATLDQAKVAVAELAKIQVPTFGNKRLEKLFKREKSAITQAQLSFLYGGFVARYKERIKPEHLKVCEQFVASFDAYGEELSETGKSHGLVHGDYRLDNMLLGGKDGTESLTVVDWQTITWGSIFGDLSYYLGCSLTVEKRRAHAEELIRIYHSGLGPNPPFTIEECYDGVRRQVFFGIVMVS